MVLVEDEVLIVTSVPEGRVQPAGHPFRSSTHKWDHHRGGSEMKRNKVIALAAAGVVGATGGVVFAMTGQGAPLDGAVPSPRRPR